MARPGSPYHGALSWLYGLESRGIKLGLDRMLSALAARGNPHEGLRVVHVAGTNGKGSTCAMVERGLRAAGHHTGWFSSPHLHRYVERVRIGGRPLAEREAARRIRSLRAADLPPLSFFEYTTLLAFEAFRDHGCDAVVLEVGLGGRLDSTNVVTPAVSVITNIALEHTQILGDTTAAIAREKAGIIKRDVPLITAVRDPDAWRVIRDRARRLRAPVSRIDRDFGVRLEPGPRGDRVVCWLGEDKSATLPAARLGLRGPYQSDNAATAAAALRAFGVSDDAVLTALRKARWPGRMERVREGGVTWFFDAAHNPAGCRALADEVRRMRPKGRVVLLFGAMSDKDHEGMLAPFDELADERIYAIPKMTRAGDPRALTEVRPGHVARSVQRGLRRAAKRAGTDGLVVVAGSIFLIAEVRAAVLGCRSDPPIGM